MLISPKYCKAKSYMADDEADEVEDDDNEEGEGGVDEDHEDEDDDDDANDNDNLHFIYYNINVNNNCDENLGIHVVGQRLRLGTPSTPSSSKSIH